MTNSNIPSFLKEENDYIPKKDNDSFVKKNLLSMMSILSKIKTEQGGYSLYSAFPLLKLIYTFVYILLCAISKNSAFLVFMLSGVIIRIAMLKGDKIKSVFKAVFSAELISMLVLLPSVIMGNKSTFVLISTKLFISVSLISILSLTTKWNDLTSSLNKLHIPSVFVFTIDTTIKYIVTLGEISLEMLDALKIRSIGKNNDKAKSMSGIVGITILKSKEMAQEMSSAMECRGFTGDYKGFCTLKWRKIDFLYLALLLIIIGVFIYLELIV